MGYLYPKESAEPSSSLRARHALCRLLLFTIMKNKTSVRYVYASHFRLTKNFFVRVPSFLSGWLSLFRFFRRRTRFSAAPAPHRFQLFFKDENL